MKLQYLGAALALGGLSLLGGCAKSGDSTATTSGSNSTPSTTTSSTGNSGGKKSVVYIPKNSGNAYFDPVIDGFKKVAAEKGFDFTTVAPADAGATSQIPFIEAQIQQGVSVIAISPNSPDALNLELKKARDKGIKVITIDADVSNEDARDAVVLPIDFSTIGPSQIDLMSSLIGGKGDIAILSATTNAPNQNAWIAGMKQALTLPKYQGLKLVEVAYGNDESQKSQRETEGLLNKYPNLKGIIAPTTVGVVAAAQTLKTKQVKTVQLTGLGMPKQMSGFVKDGTVQKFALWDPGKMGYAAGYLAAGLLDNSIKATSGGTFKAGELGTLKFDAKKTVAAGAPLVFDAKNVDQYKF